MSIKSIIEEAIGEDYTDHICRFNDGDCKCECYGKALADLRNKIPEIEKAIVEFLKYHKAQNVDETDVEDTITNITNSMLRVRNLTIDEIIKNLTS